MPEPKPAPALGLRDVHGQYQRDQYERRAIDGAVLNHVIGDVVVSWSWANKDCDNGYCPLPRFRRFFPPVKCPQHGPVSIATEPWPADLAMSNDDLRAADARAWQPLLAKWRIGARHVTARLEDSQPTIAIKAVKRFVGFEDVDVDDDYSFLGCMVLAGPPGTGKTWGAIAGFRHELVRDRSGASIVYRTMPALARGFLSDERDELLEEVLTAETWFLDDVGAV